MVTVLANTGPSNSIATGSGLWAGTPGSLQLLAHTGDQAIAMPAGRRFWSFPAPAVNRARTVAFTANVGSEPLTQGIWMGPPSDLNLAVQSGDPATGYPDGRLRWAYSPVLNNAGDLVFEARIDAGSPALLESLWFRSSGGAFAPIVAQGQPAPGTDAVFESFGALTVLGVSTVLTDDGAVTFHAKLTGPTVTTANDTGIWIASGGQIRLIARTGERAPGCPPGVTYSELSAPFPVGGGIAVDGRGNIVFSANLSGGVRALFVSDRLGRTDLLLRTGTMIVTAPGVVENLAQFAVSSDVGSGPSGRPTYLSESGELVMYLRTFSGLLGFREALAMLRLPAACYVNCDRSTAAPVLNVDDFACFVNRFAAGDPWANCDGSTAPPVLNANDFVCFLGEYAAGCP